MLIRRSMSGRRVASMATMLVAVAIPFGALHIDGKDYPLVVANMDISAFYVEAAMSLMAIAVFMAGYSSTISTQCWAPSEALPE